jgi:hypothetical protein
MCCRLRDISARSINSTTAGVTSQRPVAQLPQIEIVNIHLLRARARQHSIARQHTSRGGGSAGFLPPKCRSQPWAGSRSHAFGLASTMHWQQTFGQGVLPVVVMINHRLTRSVS